MNKPFLLTLISVFLGQLYFSNPLSTLNYYKNIEHSLKNTNSEKKKASNSTTGSYLNNDATYYYYNLTENFAKNYKGTCNYVAIAMFLSYYDTFWDDNIIPYQYEVNPASTVAIDQRTSSPGIRSDKIPHYTHEEAMNLSNSEYYNLVMEMTDTYFQPFLFKIAEDDLGYELKHNENSFATMSAIERAIFLDHYLQTYGGLEQTDYKITMKGGDGDITYSDAIKSYIVEQAKKGNPVLASIIMDSISHTCIIYDYNATSDILYLHFGNYQATVHMSSMASINTYFCSALTIEFNSKHNHSNNYILVTNGNLTYHCGCELPTHKHKYTHSYAQYNDEYHLEYCHCGASKQNLHECTGLYGRYEACIHCGTIVDLWTTGTNGVIIPKKEEIDK